MDSLDKKYYKIREVADFLNVQPSTLRFWESKFTLIKPRRNSHGTRFYTPADIEVIRMIYYLVKDRGLKLEAAEEEIRRNRTGITKKYEAVERLKQMRERLQSMLEALDARAAVMRRATRQALEEAHKAKAVEDAKAEAQEVAVAPDAIDENAGMPRKPQQGKRRRHWSPDDDMPSLF